MKEFLIFIVLIVFVVLAFNHAPGKGRYQLMEAKIEELVGVNNVVQIQQNNVLFRLDTKTGKTWRLAPLESSKDQVFSMAWQEIHEMASSATPAKK